jgi:hypothetical protein
MLFEDPMYDEDGVLMDEDQEWDDDIDEDEFDDDLSPFETINS